MATSRITNGERLGDPDDDLSYVPNPTQAIRHAAARRTNTKEQKKQKQQRLLEAFKNGDYGFVPDSQGGMTLALRTIDNQIEELYHTFQNPVPRVREMYKYLLAREFCANVEIDELSDANASVPPEKRHDESTFTVGALLSSDSAMAAVALYRVRAKALEVGNWDSIAINNIEKSKQAELEVIYTLGPEDLANSWLDAWDSTQTEYAFWGAKIKEIEANETVRGYIKTQ